MNVRNGGVGGYPDGGGTAASESGLHVGGPPGSVTSAFAAAPPELTETTRRSDPPFPSRTIRYARSRPGNGGSCHDAVPSAAEGIVPAPALPAYCSLSPSASVTCGRSVITSPGFTWFAAALRENNSIAAITGR